MYKIINSLNFREAVEYLNNGNVVAFDVESTGLNVRKEKVIGFSFTCEIGSGYYYPIYVYNTKTSSLDYVGNKEDIDNLLNLLKTKKLVMHNGSYDIRITYNNFGISLLKSLYADTMLMEHTLNENGPFGLKDIAIAKAIELGLSDKESANQEQLDLKESVEANGGKWLKLNKEMYKGDLDKIAHYAIADTDITLRYFHYAYKQLAKFNLIELFFDKEVMPLYKKVTIRMEHRGILLDMDKLVKYRDEAAIKITELELDVVNSIYKLTEWEVYLQTVLQERYPISNKGKFASKLVDLYIPNILEKNNKGKYSLNQKTLKQLPESSWKDFLLTGDVNNLNDYEIDHIRKSLLLQDEESSYFINIQSKNQLAKFVFDYLKETPISNTAKGSPQFNELFIESISTKYEWASKLRLYNKLNKIKSSYYDRFLEEQEDGIFYPSFKQHGTTSGRYSSDLQQLPRPKDEDSKEDPIIIYFNDSIRELFICKNGQWFLDNDYDSLEPRVFADDAGDDALISIFTRNLDLYSLVAIMAENIKDASADKKADNFLKKKYPQKRQNAKSYSLGIRYGMKAGKLAMTLGISNEEAQVIIDNYFKAFPNLKSKMDSYLKEAKETGMVTSKYGRVRHLPRVKEIYNKYGDDILDFSKLRSLSKKYYISIDDLKFIRKEYNNLLNNALNFPIQAAATSIVNRAAIAMTDRFNESNLNAWISVQAHDQLIVTCDDKDIDKAKEIMQDCMENTNKLAMPLIAKPEKAKNFREGH